MKCLLSYCYLLSYQTLFTLFFIITKQILLPTGRCGYHQEFSPSLCPPFTDGVLGLGSGETSILSQVSSKKVMTLCSSDKNGPGYLVLGDSLSNSPDITWRSLANDHLE